MKYIKKFENNNIQNMIDSILDNLNKKGKLSKSEKEFMNAASKGQVKDVNIPNNKSNNLLSSNPHDSHILWLLKNDNINIWKEIKTIEEEEDSKIESDYSKWEKKRILEIKKTFNENPNLENEIKKIFEKCEDLQSDIYKLYNDKNYRKDHNLNISISYLNDHINKLHNSLINGFGYHDKETGEGKIGFND